MITTLPLERTHRCVKAAATRTMNLRVFEKSVMVDLILANARAMAIAMETGVFLVGAREERGALRDQLGVDLLQVSREA